MRIAQISPLTEAVPPKLYGGTERVISWLTEELVALGHEVTLFASGDSITSARLEPMRSRRRFASWIRYGARSTRRRICWRSACYNAGRSELAGN